MSKVLVILAMCQPCRSFVPVPSTMTIVRPKAVLLQSKEKKGDDLLQSKEKKDDDLLWDGEVIEGAWEIRLVGRDSSCRPS